MSKKSKSGVFSALKTLKSPKPKPLPKVSEDDKQLFREAMKGVKEIQCDKVMLNPLDRKRTIEINRDAQLYHSPETVKQIQFDTLQNLKFGTEIKGIYASHHPHEKFVRNGIADKQLRKIRQQVQNSFVPELDLHGHTVEESHQMVMSFIHNRFMQGSRVIKIIHGKGYQSPNGDGILKYEVRKWLIQLNCVLAYFPAPDNHGGRGAIVIYLANQK